MPFCPAIATAFSKITVMLIQYYSVFYCIVGVYTVYLAYFPMALLSRSQ